MSSKSVCGGLVDLSIALDLLCCCCASLVAFCAVRTYLPGRCVVFICTYFLESGEDGILGYSLPLRSCVI